MTKLVGKVLVSCFVIGLFFLVSDSSDQPENQPNKIPAEVSESSWIIPDETLANSNGSQESTSTGFSEPTKLPDKTIQNKVPKTEIIADGVTYPNRVYTPMLVPNDPSYNQWWVAPNGMTTVWDIPAGAYQTKIAVIDTGFALNHQEFAGRLAVNAAETGITASEGPSDLNCTDQALALDRSCNNIDDNFDQILDNETGATTEQNPSDRNCTDQSLALDKTCNNLDDDGNGLKDDVSGWDFVNYDSSVQAGQVNPTGSGTTHGTLVAGVLGATGNNGVGIAGVNWHTKILPIQALDDDSYGDSFTVGQAVIYAANQGADIISISLGTSLSDPYMRSAILYALDRGSIVVAASGNNGCDCVSYPANYPEVVAVGAINSTGSPASFSNFGAQLDVLAPGQTITTPTYSSVNQTSAYAGSVAGTSFATPFFSGVLGLAKMSQPTATWEELIGTMLENSDRRTLTATSPHSGTLGYGVTRVNTMLDRLRVTNSAVQRVQFYGTLLGSKRGYECEGSIVPATKLYELTKAGIYNYTVSPRELSKAVQNGWASRDLAYVCMGLASDNVSVLRALSLTSELHNLIQKN